MIAMIPICDFCSSPSVVWRYPCEDFSLTLVFEHKSGNRLPFAWDSADGWAACEICASLIEAEDWDGLATRSYDTSPALKLMQKILVRDQVLDAIKRMHVEFRKRKQGRVAV
jgi:hypothetical protein